MTTNAKNAAMPMTHVTFLIERSDGAEDVGEYTVLGALNNSEMLIPDDKFAEICREFQARLQLLTNDKVIVQHREDLIDILQIETAEFAKGVLPEFEAAAASAWVDPVFNIGSDGKFKVSRIEFSRRPVAAGEGIGRGAARFSLVLDAYAEIVGEEDAREESVLKDLVTDIFHYYSKRGWVLPDFQSIVDEAAHIPMDNRCGAPLEANPAYYRYWDASNTREPSNDERAQRIADVSRWHATVMRAEHPDMDRFLTDIACFARLNEVDLVDVAQRAETMFEQECFDESASMAPAP
jgi:hypothetical protein